ncbi:MAG TPA: hypothetical protein VJV39_14195 [Dongiaceae bacterium]|nr:hypothetical protein [Dongiaceae bacterium]
MNLGTSILKTVVFLRKSSAEQQSCGTAFFVRTRENETFLVTCRHVARHVHKRPFVLRANAHDGNSKDIQVGPIDWRCHDDMTIDIAVTPYEWSEDLDCYAFPLKNCLTSNMRKARRIAEGNLAQVVGLFSFFEGNRRSSPVVHSGSIAMVPENDPVPILDSIYGQIEVASYLVETQASEGASGSPVFVRKPVGAKAAEEGLSVKPKAYGAIFLLGVYQGSWKKLNPDLMQDAGEKGRIRLPGGMGLVVPGDKIIETIEQASKGIYSSPD